MAKAVIPRVSLGAKIAPSSLTTNGFTLGREYPIVGTEGQLAIVVNDNGHRRAVGLDGKLSAHIVAHYERPTGRPGYGYPMQKPVGYFEVVP